MVMVMMIAMMMVIVMAMMMVMVMIGIIITPDTLGMHMFPTSHAAPASLSSCS